MTTEVCWEWFNTVFFPRIKILTSKPVLLLIDNAGRNLKEFEKHNIVVKFLPLNVMSWKQPMDLGIIAVCKQRYKHLYLKYLTEFYVLDEEAKTFLAYRSQKTTFKCRFLC